MYFKKYLKYKRKYLNIKNLINEKKGGSYVISDEHISITEIENNYLIQYPQLKICVKKRKIGQGGTGTVYSGKILQTSLDGSLNETKIIIKKFKCMNKLNYEYNNLQIFQLDTSNEIVRIPSLVPLLFKIDSGYLRNSLVYEYGGIDLGNFTTGKSYYNLANIKQIIIDLHNILNKLTNSYDNFHNDIKTDNIVYTINENNCAIIKLIDFGSSKQLSKINSDDDKPYYKIRCNMNTPEMIKMHIRLNQEFFNQEILADINYDIEYYKKWYYYPMASIIFFLFTGQEYSTGDNSFIQSTQWFKNIKNNPRPIRKYYIMTNLLDNDNIKIALRDTINTQFSYLYGNICNIFDELCKEDPTNRISNDSFINLINEKI